MMRRLKQYFSFWGKKRKRKNPMFFFILLKVSGLPQKAILRLKIIFTRLFMINAVRKCIACLLYFSFWGKKRKRKNPMFFLY